MRPQAENTKDGLNAITVWLREQSLVFCFGPAVSMAGRLRRAVMAGDMEEGSVMAGQSVALLEAEQSARDH